MKLPADKRVLVVDDDELMRNSISQILNSFDIKNIVQAPDVPTAKQIVQDAYNSEKPFDLILCDHHMPNSTGLEFLSFIRINLRYKETPYITITSDSQRTVVLPYISAGADSFIVKPVKDTDLYEKIVQVWKKRKVIT